MCLLLRKVLSLGEATVFLWVLFGGFLCFLCGAGCVVGAVGGFGGLLCGFGGGAVGEVDGVGVIRVVFAIGFVAALRDGVGLCALVLDCGLSRGVGGLLCLLRCVRGLLLCVLCGFVCGLRVFGFRGGGFGDLGGLFGTLRGVQCLLRLVG